VIPPAFGVLAAGGSLLIPAWDPASKNANVTLSNGNLTASTGAGAVDYPVHGLPSKTGGKFYFEVTITAVGGGVAIGVSASGSSLANGVFPGVDATSGGYGSTGNFLNNGGVYSAGATFTTADVIGIYYNATTGTLWWSKNGAVQFGNPIAGTGGMPGITTTGVPCASVNGSGSVTFKTPASLPSGFSAWG